MIEVVEMLRLGVSVWVWFNFSDDESCDFDWDSLGFGLMPTDYMYIMKCSKDEKFERGQMSRYGNIELSPSAGVLNYGQVPSSFSLGIKIQSIAYDFWYHFRKCCNSGLVNLCSFFSLGGWLLFF